MAAKHTLRPSVQPSSDSRLANAATHAPRDACEPGTRNPMTGFGCLGAYRERPCRGRATDQPNEFAPLHCQSRPDALCDMSEPNGIGMRPEDDGNCVRCLLGGVRFRQK